MSTAWSYRGLWEMLFAIDTNLRIIIFASVCFRITSQQSNSILEGEFYRFAKDSVFNGDVISVQWARSLFHCVSLCLVTQACNGINFHHTTNTNIFQCETVRLLGSGDTIHLLSKAGWSVYGTRPTQEVYENVTTAPIEHDSRSTTASTSDATLFVGTIISTTASNVCSLDAAFTNNNGIFLVFGDEIVEFTDLGNMVSGRTRTLSLSTLFPGISEPVDAIYNDASESQFYVVKDGMVTTYSGSSLDLPWTKQAVETHSDFWGEPIGSVSAVYLNNNDIVIIMGDTVRQIGGKKTCKYKTDCTKNVLLSTNTGEAPNTITGAFQLDSVTTIFFGDSNYYSFIKNSGDSRGTWSLLGHVPC